MCFPERNESRFDCLSVIGVHHRTEVKALHDLRRRASFRNGQDGPSGCRVVVNLSRDAIDKSSLLGHPSNDQEQNVSSHYVLKACLARDETSELDHRTATVFPNIVLDSTSVGAWRVLAHKNHFNLACQFGVLSKELAERQQELPGRTLSTKRPCMNDGQEGTPRTTPHRSVRQEVGLVESIENRHVLLGQIGITVLEVSSDAVGRADHDLCRTDAESLQKCVPFRNPGFGHSPRGISHPRVPEINHQRKPGDV